MLTFNEERHEYRWNGNVVPSVTQILAPLYDWSHIPEAILDRARARGTAVHKMVELDVARDLDESSVHGELLGYLEQWREFVAVTGYKVKRSELRLYSKRYGYAGTIDSIGVLKKEPESLTDWKSGAVMAVAKPQTAAYEQLAIENGICVRPVRRCLALTEKSWKFTSPYTDPNDMRVFLSMLTIHNYRKAHPNG